MFGVHAKEDGLNSVPHQGQALSGAGARLCAGPRGRDRGQRGDQAASRRRTGGQHDGVLPARGRRSEGRDRGHRQVRESRCGGAALTTSLYIPLNLVVS